jgi:ribosomal protein L35
MANFKFYVDDVLIGQEALMTVLGIDPSDIPKNKIKDFEVSPNILTKKGTKQKRNLTYAAYVSDADMSNVKMMLTIGK